jgi:hypothetical protein
MFTSPLTGRKIMEINRKFNKKMHLSLYILGGWLLDGSAGTIQCATSTGAALLDLEEGAGRLVPAGPAIFRAVRAEPERLLEILGSP